MLGHIAGSGVSARGRLLIEPGETDQTEPLGQGDIICVTSHMALLQTNRPLWLPGPVPGRSAAIPGHGKAGDPQLLYAHLSQLFSVSPASKGYIPSLEPPAGSLPGAQLCSHF